MTVNANPTSPFPGRRIENGWHEYEAVSPGDYWQPENAAEGEWWFRDPFGSFGRVTTHTVTVHPNGTITVRPSIAPRPDDPPGSFHGWLTEGVWTW